MDWNDAIFTVCAFCFFGWCVWIGYKYRIHKK